MSYQENIPNLPSKCSKLPGCNLLDDLDVLVYVQLDWPLEEDSQATPLDPHATWVIEIIDVLDSRLERFHS